MPYADIERRRKYLHDRWVRLHPPQPPTAHQIEKALAAQIVKTDVELAWCAGIFEGEGTIHLRASTLRNRGVLIVNVINTDPDVVRPFVEWWPACHTRQPTVKPHHRPAWVWIAATRTAASFLSEILPFVRTARVRDKIGLALEFQAQKSKSSRINRSPEYLARQAWYCDRMRQLNAKGRAAPCRDDTALLAACKEAALFRRAR